MPLDQKFTTLLVIVAVARAQHPFDRKHTADSKSSQFSPRVSFNPANVCFNPHFDDYMFNDFVRTCPIPRPNSYHAGSGRSTRDSDSPDALKSSCRLEGSLHGDDRFLAPPRPWHGKGFVPLVYLPSAVAKNGRIDRKAIKYLKKLKDDLNSNPLLNQSANGINARIEGLCIATAAKSADGDHDGKRTKRETENSRTQTRRIKRAEDEYRNFYPVQNIMYGDPINAPPRTTYKKANFIDAWHSK